MLPLPLKVDSCNCTSQSIPRPIALCKSGLALGEKLKGEPEAVRCVRNGDWVPGLKPRVYLEVERGEEA